MGNCIIFCAADFHGLAASIRKDDFVIAADGGLYTFAAKVKSTVNEAKPATAIVAVYNASGNLVSASFVSKNIPALAEETIAASEIGELNNLW